MRWAVALPCTVVSTITCSNAILLTAFVVTVASMVVSGSLLDTGFARHAAHAA
jgi:hypothetical protein